MTIKYKTAVFELEDRPYTIKELEGLVKRFKQVIKEQDKALKYSALTVRTPEIQN